MRRIGPALVAAAALAGCGGGGHRPATPATASAPARPQLHDTRCDLELPGFRCAQLRVPLHRRGAHARDGETLTLDVAIQRVARAPRGDLVLLTGGPGQPGRAFGPRMAERLRDALRGYRLITLDQRGTGGGALTCPALQAQMGSSDLAVPSRAAVVACARALGARRDAFATADTVADLDDLRAALGVPRWVLAGVSYGTFVAERYARAHPDRTRGLVLDSVVPQAGAELLERVPLQATARVLRAVCAAQRATPCAGDPADDLRAVLARRPALGPRILDAVTGLSIGVPHLDAVPAVLHRARTGDVAPLMDLLGAVRRAEAAPAALLSQGLHAATLCADSPAPWPGGPAAPAAVRERTLQRLRTTLTAADTGAFDARTALGQGLLLTCRWWPPVAAPPAPDSARSPIAAPALLLAGDRDLSTPLEWAQAQAARMPHARLVVVPGAGHSVLSRAQDPRGRRAVATFLAGLP